MRIGNRQHLARDTLDELRAIQNNCGQFLLDLEARERARSGIANLKVEYNRVHGFYIEVSRAQSEKVPDDYRRRQTLKNAERYITPELKAFEDKALSAQERALAREKLLYERVLDELAPHVPALQQLASAVAEIDALAAFAERAASLPRHHARAHHSRVSGGTAAVSRGAHATQCRASFRASFVA